MSLLLVASICLMLYSLLNGKIGLLVVSFFLTFCVVRMPA